MEKCYIIFEDGREPYEFSLDKMATAIKYSHDEKWPVLAIKTPYYYMSLIDAQDFENIMKGTKVVLPSGAIVESLVQSEGGEAGSKEAPESPTGCSSAQAGAVSGDSNQGAPEAHSAQTTL